MECQQCLEEIKKGHKYGYIGQNLYCLRHNDPNKKTNNQHYYKSNKIIYTSLNNKKEDKK